jgi:hypothetical protein
MSFCGLIVEIVNDCTADTGRTGGTGSSSDAIRLRVYNGNHNIMTLHVPLRLHYASHAALHQLKPVHGRDDLCATRGKHCSYGISILFDYLPSAGHTVDRVMHWSLGNSESEYIHETILEMTGKQNKNFNSRSVVFRAVSVPTNVNNNNNYHNNNNNILF